MRIGLTAAGVLAVLVLALVLVTNGRARPSTVHTCSATDRQFIETARTNMTALELWSEQYQSGDASGKDVEGQARSASKIMRGTGPTDSSLQVRPGESRIVLYLPKRCLLDPKVADDQKSGSEL